MKQAICLLAYKSFNYVQAFIDQFENHPDLYFYIHWHGHSQEECVELQNRNANIKYICNQYNTTRFSHDLIFAELHLYYVAALDNDIAFCHLMSESDYLICSPNFFVGVFNKAKDSNFITYVTSDFRVNACRSKIWGKNYIAHKASQWKSLNIDTVHKLLDCSEISEKLIDSFENQAKKFFVFGAADEYIIPTILINEIRIYDNDLKSNKRYISWIKCFDHPNLLTWSKYLDKSYYIKDNEVTSNLIVRKIDIFDEDSKRFVDKMKIKFNERFINKYN